MKEILLLFVSLVVFGTGFMGISYGALSEKKADKEKSERQRAIKQTSEGEST